MLSWWKAPITTLEQQSCPSFHQLGSGPASPTSARLWEPINGCYNAAAEDKYYLQGDGGVQNGGPMGFHFWIGFDSPLLRIWKKFITAK